MANAFANVKDAGQWVVMESLALLESKRSVSQFFNTDYSKEFKLKFPVGDSIKVPYPDAGSIREGLEFSPSALERRYATISIGTPFGSDFELDSLESLLSAPRRAQFSKMVLEPRMTKLAQEIESRCALYAYQHSAGVVGALGTNPSTYDATSGAARQGMVELGAPEGWERGMLIPPAVMRAVKTSNIALHNPVTDISKQFRTGIVQQADSFEWYESMSLYRHTAGTWQGAVTLASAAANGATTLSLTCTTGDTFRVGDKIAIGSVLPVHPMTKRTFGTATKTITCLGDGVGGTVTGASSAATISISPPLFYEGSFQNVNSQPAASAALTLWPGTTSPNGKVGTVGLAIPHNAFAMVSLDFEEFTDVEFSKTQRDPDSGVSLTYTRSSDVRSRKKINRIDACIGFGEFYSDLAHVVACA